MKSNQRTAFTFYRSYYDILNKLDDKSGYQFLKALLDKQFLGVEPNLEGMADFAYMSQKHSIDKQVEGWENKTGNKLRPNEGSNQDPHLPPTEGGSIPPSYHPSNDSVMTTEGGSEDPYKQEKEKEEEKEEEKEQEQEKSLIYKSNKTEIEYIRDLYSMDLDDAVDFFLQTSFS